MKWAIRNISPFIRKRLSIWLMHENQDLKSLPEQYCAAMTLYVCQLPSIRYRYYRTKRDGIWSSTLALPHSVYNNCYDISRELLVGGKTRSNQSIAEYTRFQYTPYKYVVWSANQLKRAYVKLTRKLPSSDRNKYSIYNSRGRLISTHVFFSIFIYIHWMVCFDMVFHHL